jgi:nucleoside-diphosphate-sugar epimerase
LRWLHGVLATAYGPHAHTETHRSHFMSALIARAAAAKAARASELEVWGHPATVRDLLYVSDPIEASIAAESELSVRHCGDNRR